MNQKYLLSLDGGGVRQIATITFLAKLENALNQPLFEKFDFFWKKRDFCFFYLLIL